MKEREEEEKAKRKEKKIKEKEVRTTGKSSAFVLNIQRKRKHGTTKKERNELVSVSVPFII
jgi:hypothetical protein